MARQTGDRRAQLERAQKRILHRGKIIKLRQQKHAIDQQLRQARAELKGL